MEHDLLLDQYVLKPLVIKYLFLEKGFSKSLLELSISKFCGNEVYKVEKSKVVICLTLLVEVSFSIKLLVLLIDQNLLIRELR